jgi:hypothetical protein
VVGAGKKAMGFATVASCHGPLQERWLTTGGAHDNGAESISKWGEAQASKTVSNKLETPKTDGSIEGRNIVWRTLDIGSGDEQ